MQPLLEPIVRKWRIYRVLPDLPKGGVLVDVGCGTTPELIRAIHHRFDQSIGIDITVKSQKKGVVRLIKQDLQKKLNLPAETANLVTMLAVLEHLDFPQEILNECYRILKSKGVLLLTVPSPNSALLLNILSGINLISPEMIKQHKHYFTPYQLRQLFKLAGFKKIEIKTFQMGLNTYVKAVK